ncbi:hypothetical protein BBO99_00005149 [Phytophthora kernoviae]|uniref:Uncharacterized protein n=2 Tax=Phytophthora kernoviae TaxID=325452 RepID=A0A3R7JTS0_9STRA|nr:hypothetical protein G195_005679 [Phytophthora kernoviae 00238/432]KAG2523348.1 hypothetical protein JM16_005274 [Phytophthora kernoviae]KAG2526338.1 hypothetical protein JM18_004432 [Phytophthora kernoviae]RLN37634.1 hypothetical protein BBI17_005294 [Phytophthora kernoviae]RLN79595.1 hypothetical protein BBO99_00005149 [Phytophthora kernoviae]
MRSFQDAFIEALRGPYEAAALAQQTSSSGTSPSGKTRWRRVDLRSFLTSYFPQYAQQPAAFAALCASLSAKAASVGNREGDGKEENEKSTETDDVMVTFDALKRVLVRQYCSTRLLAKDPFPLEACVETKRAERRPSVAPFVAGSSGDESGPGYATSLPELREFQADVMKKSQSWLGRWRARHLVLKWGTLEMHKRSLAARSFRHVHSSASSSGTFISDGSGSISSSGISTAGTTTKTTKTYDLCDLVSLKLEQLSDGDSVRKAALTLQFQTLLTPSSNSHSNPTATASHDIKTLMLGALTTRPRTINDQNAPVC